MHSILIQSNADAALARKELIEAVQKGMQMSIDNTKDVIEFNKRQIEAREYKPINSPECRAFIYFGITGSTIGVLVYLCYLIWNFGL